MFKGAKTRRQVLLSLTDNQIDYLATTLGARDNLLLSVEHTIDLQTLGYNLRQYKNKVKELLGGM